MFLPVRYIPLIMLITLTWGTTTAPVPISTAPASAAYLALGDSYTIGESVSREDRYPVQAVQMLRADGQPCQDPEIIATTGWTTGDLLKALSTKTATTPYAIVTLLIGVNNQYQGLSRSEYRDEFSRLLERSIQLAGNKPSHVIVLSIPDYSITPFARGANTALIATQIDSFNATNADVSERYRVHYLDITAESRKAAGDPSMIAGDGLHFSGKEYALWARIMEPEMKKILN
jgi:lysophospholipase L1-like esterase